MKCTMQANHNKRQIQLWSFWFDATLIERIFAVDETEMNIKFMFMQDLSLPWIFKKPRSQQRTTSLQKELLFTTPFITSFVFKIDRHPLPSLQLGKPRSSSEDTRRIGKAFLVPFENKDILCPLNFVERVIHNTP